MFIYAYSFSFSITGGGKKGIWPLEMYVGWKLC